MESLEFDLQGQPHGIDIALRYDDDPNEFGPSAVDVRVRAGSYLRYPQLRDLPPGPFEFLRFETVPEDHETVSIPLPKLPTAISRLLRGPMSETFREALLVASDMLEENQRDPDKRFDTLIDFMRLAARGR